MDIAAVTTHQHCRKGFQTLPQWLLAPLGPTLMPTLSTLNAKTLGRPPLVRAIKVTAVLGPYLSPSWY